MIFVGENGKEYVLMYEETMRMNRIQPLSVMLLERSGRTHQGLSEEKL